jgi:hypothetical protein
MLTFLTPSDRYSLRTAMGFFISCCPWDVLQEELDGALPHERQALIRTFEIAFGHTLCATADLATYIKQNMR